jgi:phage-related protein
VTGDLKILILQVWFQDYLKELGTEEEFYWASPNSYITILHTKSEAKISE